MKEKAIIQSFFRAKSLREGGKVALVDYDTEVQYSYAEMSARADKVARFLKDKLKLSAGDRVALCTRNGPWSLDVFCAMPIVGCILTTYNCMLKGDELLETIQYESPRVVFYEQLYQEKIAAFRAKMPNTVFIPVDGEASLSQWTYDDILASPAWEGEWVDTELEDICMLAHTGGTTGSPKAAMISYRAILLNTIGQIITYGITEADIAYVSFPFFHCASWNSALPLLVCGGKIYLKRKFDVSETLRMVEQDHLTMLAGSPSIFRRLSLSPLFEQCDFSSVRALRCGSATPTEDLMQKYWVKGKQLLFYNGYGMTEAGPGTLALPASSMSREFAAEKAGSVGKPMIFTKVRIVDEAGNDVPVGQEGELLVKNGNMFSGYWNKPEATTEAVKDGWLYTGDIVRCDRDGFYFVCGRKKNMYICGGENIYPPEIETFILNHPAVSDAYVFGVPDEIWGEAGKAIVALRNGVRLSRDELKKHLAQHLSTIKLPKYIQFVENVPRNDAGKIIGKTVEALYRFPGENAEPREQNSDIS